VSGRSSAGHYASGSHPTGRVCTECGLPLSQYNSGSLCQACVGKDRRAQPESSGKIIVNGRKIAELRRSHGWTQSFFADRIGFSVETVKKLERNARRSTRLATLNTIAHAFNVPLNVLLIPADSAESSAQGSPESPESVNDPARQTAGKREPARWQAVLTSFGHARKISGFTQESLAEKLGVERSTVILWERGETKPQLHMRPKLAQVLGISGHELEELLRADDRVAVDATRQNSPAVDELCSVLTDYGFNLGRFTSIQGNEVPSPGDLERDLKIAFNAYQQSRYTAAASRASALLADAQLTMRECKEAERARVLKVLALSYQAAASVLTKAGEPDLALIAAERGLHVAQTGDNPTVRASLIRSVAFALYSTGRLEPAMRLVESGTSYLRDEITRDNTGLSVYGMLFLVGAMAAAHFGDGSKAADYLQEATGAASRIGKDANHLWTAFGPTNVAIHRVNTAVELGDLQTVLNSGMSLNTGAVPLERRVRYLLDVARVYSITGNRDDALGTMLTAERMAPEQVRLHHLSSKVVMTLIRGTKRKRAIELDKLAKRVNLRGSA
jgi:transcriptional regulator with XRE-family HTH domain